LHNSQFLARRDAEIQQASALIIGPLNAFDPIPLIVKRIQQTHIPSLMNTK